VFRQNSCTAVLGLVTTDFRSTATREALSPNLGTRSPASVVVSGDKVVFLDQHGRFQAAQLGVGVKEIGTGSRDTMRAIPATNYTDVQAIDDVETGHLKFAMADLGQDDPSFEIWLDREDGRFACTVRGYEFTRMGFLKDGSGVLTHMHGGGADASTSDTGYVYAHDHPDGSTWDDEFQFAPLAIGHYIEAPAVGHDTQIDKLWTRGEISLLPVTSVSGATLGITTSYGSGTAMVLEDIATGGTPLGSFILGVDSLSSGTNEETKRTFGMRERGRWARLSFAHSHPGERLAINELALVSTPVTRRPEVP